MAGPDKPRAKKQHYVPQFLLRPFARVPGSNQISVYRLAEGRAYTTSIRDVAHENHFYKRQEVEAALSDLEGAASRVIDAIVRTGTVPKDGTDGHISLVRFVGVQLGRTRAACDVMNDQADKLTKYLASRDPLLPPELAESIPHVRVHLPDAVALNLRTALETCVYMADLRCKLLCNRTDRLFLTSDNPAAKYNSFLERRRPERGNTGLAVKGLQIYLPVTPRHALFFFDSDVYTVGGRKLSIHRVDVTDPKDVAQLNLLQAVNAGNALLHSGPAGCPSVSALAQKARRLRPEQLSELNVCYPTNGDVGRHGTLLVMKSGEPRLGLDLRFVKVTPQAQRFDVSDGRIHYRDPTWVRIHRRWRKELEEGLWDGADFERFLNVTYGLPPLDPAA